MIVGTAGHIDHGKTTLIKCLTSVNTDSLEEEKKRGISINIGFAYLSTPMGNMIGFVDVPGHEKFITNMLAGACGIDFCLLVVAADDGVMPQTKEHLIICENLGITDGAVVVTKTDLVGPADCEIVIERIKKFLRKSFLKDCQFFQVSNKNLDGIRQLKDYLLSTNIVKRSKKISQNFRLPIDRCFTKDGAGTVVTGTIFSGEIKKNDYVTLLPQGKKLRVKGIRAQSKETTIGRVGDRCALNLTGNNLKKNEISRGNWIVETGLSLVTRRVDGFLHLSDSEPKALKHNSIIHLHIGTQNTVIKLAVLHGEEILPGHSGFVQFISAKEFVSTCGDHFIVRDENSTRTLGGGLILNPDAKCKFRRKKKNIVLLKALLEGVQSNSERLEGRLLKLVRNGFDYDWLVKIFNIRRNNIAEWLDDSGLVKIPYTGGSLVFELTFVDNFKLRVVQWLKAYHKKNFDIYGPDINTLFEGVGGDMPLESFNFLLKFITELGIIKVKMARYYYPEHRPKLVDEDRILFQKIEKVIHEDELSPPRITELFLELQINAKKGEILMAKLEELGHVCKIRKNQYFLAETVQRLAKKVEELANAKGKEKFTMAEFRTVTKLSRGLTIPFLEFFDRSGLTTRFSTGRRIKNSCSTVFGCDDY